MSELRPALTAYLARHFPGAEMTTLVADASSRRFHRIRPAKGPARIVMDYGESFSGETDDECLARIFQKAGLPVADVLHSDGEAGCLVLEDLGNRTLESFFAENRGDSWGVLDQLTHAVELAVRIATVGTPALAASPRAGGPALDAARFRFEMDFFVEHYIVGLLQREPLDQLRIELYRLAEEAAATPKPVLCHRDYHSRNLMVLDDGDLAMVDIQDARWGPDTYDLASLLRDAYVDIDESWVEPLVESYRSALSEPPEPAAFRMRFDLVSVQRMLKALGTFGFQTTEKESERYLDAVTRTVERLRRLLPTLPEVDRLRPLLDLAGVLG